MLKLGGLSRPLDLRDLKLGRVSAPTTAIPSSYKTDVSWLKPLFQGYGTPYCGAHAGAILKLILDVTSENEPNRSYSPEYLWKKIKQIDGHPPVLGTDMRSILKTLKANGICDLTLLPNDILIPIEQYTAPQFITKEMDENAYPRIIKAYGFAEGGYLKQAIYENKAVLVLLTIGDTWFNPIVAPYVNALSGHFVVAYGYDENFIYIIDSGDDKFPFKKLVKNYSIREIGTAVDLPDGFVIKASLIIRLAQQAISLLQKLLKVAK